MPPNKWIEHVKQYANKHRMKYADALKDTKCKASYKKISGGMINEGEDEDEDEDEEYEEDDSILQLRNEIGNFISEALYSVGQNNIIDDLVDRLNGLMGQLNDPDVRDDIFQLMDTIISRMRASRIQREELLQGVRELAAIRRRAGNLRISPGRQMPVSKFRSK
jgi:hypothetical protein